MRRIRRCSLFFFANSLLWNARDGDNVPCGGEHPGLSERAVQLHVDSNSTQTAQNIASKTPRCMLQDSQPTRTSIDLVQVSVLTFMSARFSSTSAVDLAMSVFSSRLLIAAGFAMAASTLLTPGTARHDNFTYVRHSLVENSWMGNRQTRAAPPYNAVGPGSRFR